MAVPRPASRPLSAAAPNVLFQPSTPQPPHGDQLHFYASQYASPYGAAVPVQASPYGNLGRMAPAGSMPQATYVPANGAPQQQQIRVDWRAAFTTGGLDGEPPLMEELGINPGHIWAKAVAVLNPFKPIDQHIMDDTDLAGPLLFCLMLGVFLLLSGKAHFSYIYGMAALGCAAMYAILNLMSDNGIDVGTTASVLGYCLLPLVLLSMVSVVLGLGGWIGPILTWATIGWCTYSSSSMFVTVLRMNEQHALVAYPVGLLYAMFALITAF
ncbi:hypothetical protein GGF31_006908 [Allomyces arbusculus]|nr:hypothetical protein GGF31_006908 [Allomyces arbusculus]